MFNHLMETDLLFPGYSEGALVSEISGVAVWLVYFFSFMSGGRDPSPSPSSSFGSEHAVHTSGDEHSDPPLLFDFQLPQFEYLQSPSASLAEGTVQWK